MEIRIIEEGDNLHHLFMGNKDIWLTTDALKDLSHKLEYYSVLKGLNKL